MRLEECDGLFSQQALDMVSKPGGYSSGLDLLDPVTGKLMSLYDPEVPLALAEHLLNVHSEANGHAAKGWEASMAAVGQDLHIRCDEVQQRCEKLQRRCEELERRLAERG